MSWTPKSASGDLRTALWQHFATSTPRDLSKVFAAWLRGGPKKDAEFVSIVNDAAGRGGARQSFPTVAILAMAAHADALGRTQIEVLKSGLIRQAGRDPVVERVPMAFMLDAVGIFCIAIGAKAIADATIIRDLGSWSAKFLRNVYDMDKTEDWERCLLAVAGKQLNSPHLTIPDSPAVADVRVVLASKGFMNTTDIEAKDNAIRTLALGVLAPPTEQNCDRTALRAAAVDAVIATVAGELRLPVGLAPKEPRQTKPASSPRPETAPSPGGRSDDATTAKRARAMTVASLIKELNQLKPQLFEDESEYNRLRNLYPRFLAFKIAEARPDL